MSLLPTTRINSLVSSTNSNGAAEPGLPGHDEDILLVDFQPVVVPNNQIMSSPSTTNSTSMYPLVSPATGGGQLPGAHMVGINHHLSISSDGMATPISATGSSGKAHNNNYSLVSIANHAHHNNNTSRDESDISYHHPPTHLPHHIPPSSTIIPISPPLTQVNLSYDENDEFERHQALAQPSYMMNKRRTRRFVARDNHAWDNANHVGLHQQPHQQHVSSSLSSSEDSDTGFLMGTRKTAFTRRSVQRVVDPPANPVGGGNGSPSATTGLLPNLGNRKRVRRKRPSARNRKPLNSQRDKIPNPSDVLSLCCCLCGDDQPLHSTRRSTATSSLKSRYLRLTCFIVMIIVIAVLTSVTVSLQRKVDSLNWSLTKLDQAVGSPLSADAGSGAMIVSTKSSESIDALQTKHDELNSTVAGLKVELEKALGKIQDLQKEANEAAAKPDGVADVIKDLAKLGSRVEEISAKVTDVQASVEKLKSQTAINANSNGSSDGGGSSETKSTIPTASSSL